MHSDGVEPVQPVSTSKGNVFGLHKWNTIILIVEVDVQTCHVIQRYAGQQQFAQNLSLQQQMQNH